MANLKRPELKLAGNVSENFKKFELQFNHYCIQANYRNLTKDPVAEKAAHYKSPLLEIQLYGLHFQTKPCLLSDTQWNLKLQTKIKRNPGFGWTNYEPTTRVAQEVHF